MAKKTVNKSESRKKNAIKFVVFLMAALMLFSAIAMSAIYIFGDDLSDMKSELSDINADISALEKKIKEGKAEANALSGEIKKVEKKVYTAQLQLNQLREQINETKGNIQTALGELENMENSMNEQNKSLGNRLRAMYKNGDISMLSVLLGSANMSDFLTNIELAKRIYNSDEELLKEMETDYAAIVKKKQQLSDLKDTLLAEQAALQENKDALDKAESELEAQKKMVENNNAQLEKQIDDLNDEADRITAEILKLQSSGDYSGGVMCWPSRASTKVTSPFGNRMHPILKKYKMHTGIDIGAKSGTDILAANSGKVIASAYNAGGYGYYVMIDHGGGIVTLYAHSSKLLVSKGDVVTRGQVIAKVGSTGMSTGAHLHFEVRINGNYVNPLEYVTPGKY